MGEGVRLSGSRICTTRSTPVRWAWRSIKRSISASAASTFTGSSTNTLLSRGSERPQELCYEHFKLLVMQVRAKRFFTCLVTVRDLRFGERLQNTRPSLKYVSFSL